MPSASPSPRARPRIAFLCDSIIGCYQDRITSGAKRAALSLGADFVCFLGGYFTDNGRVSNRFDASFIYDLARAPAVDGLVVVTTVLANGVGVDYVREYCEKSGLPVVSIGWLPGFPYVLPDNRSGLHALLEHLILDHHYKRFAFIQGSAGNPESLERESEFRDVLASHGLPIREDLILPGNFVQGSGVLAVRELFDTRRLSVDELDVIVAANDLMASGAISELSSRGIAIPQEIAVVGFDDDDNAALIQPALTTVRQPLETIGQRAVELLLDRLRGQTTPDCVRVETTPVLRASCGCARHLRGVPEPTNRSKPQVVPNLERLRRDCQKAAVPLFGGGPSDSERGTGALIDSLAQALEGSEVDLDPFARAVLKTATDGDDPQRWQDILQLVEVELDRQQAADPLLFERGRWFLVQANLVVTQTAARAHVATQAHAPHPDAGLQILNRALLSAKDENALSHILTEALPSLGIRFCCACLFEDTPADRSRARVIATYDSRPLQADAVQTLSIFADPAKLGNPSPGGGPWWLHNRGTTGSSRAQLDSDSASVAIFPTQNLLPVGLRSDDAPTFLSVHPLSFGRQPLGYTVFDQPWHEHHWTPSTIAVNLSTAVYVLRQADSLRSARQTAEAASVAKGEFVARMSHEIRTPLTAVMGYLELCLHRISSPDERRYLTQAHASSRVLLGVLNDVLDFSKIEAQRLEVEHTRFDMSLVLDQIVATCAAAAFAKGVELVLDVAQDVPKVIEGDPLRLTQVLVNLVGNAIKFTAKGEVLLSIDNLPQAGATNSLRFCVQDTGIGIAPENISKLMDPFVQADNSTTRRYGGSGLGLAICQRLVHRMGGTLDLRSELGRGTECSFSLEVAGTSEFHFRDDLGQWPELQVLVVDDNPVSLEVVTRMLTQAGCGVKTAVDGEATLALLAHAQRSNDPVQLLLIDQGLPGRTGSDVVRRLVELGLVGDCRILIMAPLGELESSSTLLAPEVMSGIVSKPVRRSALAEQIRNLFHLPEDELGMPPPSSDRPDARDILAGKRVLVVQDDETNRMLAKEVLEGAGLEVHAVENGVDAVQRVAEVHYDAILMDLNLPLMDGCEATRIIRQNPAHAALPIIAITASASREDRGRCFDAGMNDFVQTPIDSADLLTVLANWVRARSVGTPAVKAASSRSAPLSFRSQSAGTADIPEVGSDWLDVRGTLRRLRSDASLYRRLLRRFLESHRTTVEQLRDIEQATILLRSVHTLSSAAANIGALQLHRAAQTLELELRAGSPGTDAAWAHFDCVLKQTLQLVATASGNSTSPPAGLADRDRLREELTTLATLLDRFDSTASDFVEKLPAVVGSGAINEEVYRIQRAVRAYDFEGAGQQVQALLTTLKPSGN